MNEFVVRINGSLKQVKIVDENIVEIDNVQMNYAITELSPSKFILKINNKIYETSLWKKSDSEDSILVNNYYTNLNIRTTLQEKAYKLLSASQSNTETETIIKSPMP